jgi:hypothetical protein
MIKSKASKVCAPDGDMRKQRKPIMLIGPRYGNVVEI